MRGVFYMILSYHKKQYLTERQSDSAAAAYAREAIRYMDERFGRRRGCPLSISASGAERDRHERGRVPNTIE